MTQYSRLLAAPTHHHGNGALAATPVVWSQAVRVVTKAVHIQARLHESFFYVEPVCPTASSSQSQPLSMSVSSF